MAIEWNTITWYSRLLTIVVFVGILPVLNFYIGVTYQETTDALQNSVDSEIPQYICPVPQASGPSAEVGTTTIR